FQAAVNSFPVMHLYGSLGSLHKGDDSYLEFGGGPDHPAQPKTILAAAERIRLYHQAQFNEASWNQIGTCLTEAETICFLGFGFYPINIKLLRNGGLGKHDKTRLYASGFGLTPAEQYAAIQALNMDVKF